MGNQKDLFEGIAVDLKEIKPAAVGAPSGASGGGEPPARFAPMAGEYGDALPLGRYA